MQLKYHAILNFLANAMFLFSLATAFLSRKCLSSVLPDSTCADEYIISLS